MVNKKKEEYELVPEKKFVALAKKVDELVKNPLLETKTAVHMETRLEEVNDSIISLLDVMKLLSDDIAFDEKEKHLIKKEIKPVVTVVNQIKEQNETIANAMVNIIDRITDLQSQVSRIEKIVRPPLAHIQNTSLPPLSGGTTPPAEAIHEEPKESEPELHAPGSPIPPPK